MHCAVDSPALVSQEQQAMACARYGLTATAVVVTMPWNASVASAISSGLSRTFEGFAGCCAPSLWCNASSASCTTFGVGSSFINYGWTLDLTLTPVYSCSNGTAAAPTTQPVLGTVTPTAVSALVSTVQVEGTALGNSSATALLQIGDEYCTGVTMCHRMCAVCDSDAACGAGMYCLLFAGESVGHCSLPCSVLHRCPCGSLCVAATGFRDGVCLNTDYASAGPCNGNSTAREFLPSDASGFDSRVECTLSSPLSSTCGNRGPLAVAYAIGSTVAAGATLSLFANVTECTSHADCGSVTLCTVPSCRSGCCEYEPTGRCNTEAAGAGGTTSVITSIGYAMLPTESAALLSPTVKK